MASSPVSIEIFRGDMLEDDRFYRSDAGRDDSNTTTTETSKREERIKEPIDVLLFNPPYVVTPSKRFTTLLLLTTTNERRRRNDDHFLPAGDNRRVGGRPSRPRMPRSYPRRYQIVAATKRRDFSRRRVRAKTTSRR